MPEPTRLYGLASLRVYDPGCGWPVITDEGWDWYDILEARDTEAVYSVDAATGATHLEVIDGLGLTCRPFPVFYDMSASQWALSGGTWEARRAAAGWPRLLELRQVDATPNVAWTATSNFAAPENPSFLLSLTMARTAAGHTGTGAPPTVDVQFGDEWRVRFGESGESVLRKVAGIWVLKEQISIPAVGDDENARRWLLVRCLDGKVLLSGDWGREYLTLTNENGTDITVLSAPIVAQGVSRAVGFGLHQVRHYEGTYTSRQARTNKVRTGATPAISTTATEWLPTGATTQGEDTAPGGDKAQYKLTLIPAGYDTQPFVWYSPPVVGAVWFSYPVVTGADPGTYTTPLDTYLQEARITKPRELHAATADVQATADVLPAGLDVTSDPWRFRPALLRLGHVEAGGVEVWDLEWKGYAREMAPAQAGEGRIGVRVLLDGGAAPAKERFWLSPYPLGVHGYVNTAINAVLDRLAWPADKRSLHASGDTVVVNVGKWNDPEWLPRPGDPYWRCLDELATHAGMEIGVTDDGTIYTVPVDYVNPAAAVEWQVDSPAAAEEILHQLEARIAAGESYSGIVVRGQDYRGRPIEASVVFNDVGDTANPRWLPWPRVRVEHESDRTTVARLTRKLDAIYEETMPLRQMVRLESQARAGLTRRRKILVKGSEIGLPDDLSLVVMTVEHRWSQWAGEMRTEVGARSE